MHKLLPTQPILHTCHVDELKVHSDPVLRSEVRSPEWPLEFLLRRSHPLATFYFQPPSILPQIPTPSFTTSPSTTSTSATPSSPPTAVPPAESALSPAQSSFPSSAPSTSSNPSSLSVASSLPTSTSSSFGVSTVRIVPGLAGGIVIVAVAGFLLWRWRHSSRGQREFRTAPPSRPGEAMGPTYVLPHEPLVPMLAARPSNEPTSYPNSVSPQNTPIENQGFSSPTVVMTQDAFMSPPDYPSVPRTPYEIFTACRALPVPDKGEIVLDGVAVALADHVPKQGDKLALCIGDKVVVEEVLENGWARGRRVADGLVGLFPSAAVLH
ncbi:hypothetical protein BDK51DRAFT_43222 [Blyttiomyces helicus]|uniref:SH3 domain-containing protein n=1 Tax=Blyttiomyces helicus TaxID=388810 RepID=A0A4P9WQ69_9FUNG|nr:hypothetical protein BDK51DRAFT_43222 [Blyttiomyces helicus]|eukprot:RKO94732.1 hypothetical protein BDK51DRAFT_43222 [Blyttiomyces helicus]